MTITKIGNPEIVMHNPDSRHNYFAWPTATRLQNGKIAVVASGYRLKHVCPFGKTVISYSEDDGKTYTAPAPVFDTPLDDRDGGIMTFGDKGVIVTAFNNNRELQNIYLKSEWLRNASSWIKDMEQIDAYTQAYLNTITDEDEEKYLGSLYRVSNDCGVTFGPIYKCPVSSPHGPCELPDGTILYVGTLFEYAAKKPENVVEAYAITADGKSEFRGRIEPIFSDDKRLMSYEPHAFALKDGTVICHIRVEYHDYPNKKHMFTTYQSVSKDGGRTWTKPEALLGTLGGAPAHIMQHSSGALISVYGYRERPCGIKVMISFDEGKTWDIDHELATMGNFDIGYPSTVELNDGSLLTVFYARPDLDGPAIIMQQKWNFEK